jgi:peroxiredoxin
MKNRLALVALLLMSANFSNAQTPAPPTTLKAQLDARKAESMKKTPPERAAAAQKAIDDVTASGILQRAMKKGDKAPDFELGNASGQKIKLSDYLKKGAVVLTWYRGGWCPYCNLSLNALQERLAEFKATGANLLALSPELPDKSMTTKEKQHLQFEVLSDINNTVARQYGVAYKLPESIKDGYKKTLMTYNGNEGDELPLAATYIIDQSGMIRYVFVSADYRERAEPAELLNMLKQLSTSSNNGN